MVHFSILSYQYHDFLQCLFFINYCYCKLTVNLLTCISLYQFCIVLLSKSIKYVREFNIYSNF
uniref:Uncharacterized protein n=1 Tax=Anguilla anguilla TaxID=7936 RepID=A0A0E9X4H0_ANGAN